MERLESGKIKLNAFESVAYYWIRRIKKMADTMDIEQLRDKGRKEFLSIFKQFSEQDYRALFLDLTEKYEQYYNENGAYKETTSTARNGHVIFNAFASDFLGYEVPDVSIGIVGVSHEKILIEKRNSEPVACIHGCDLSSFFYGRINDEFLPNAIIDGEFKEEEKDKE